MQLPDHTHRLQALVKLLFKPLNVYYSQPQEKLLRNKCGCAIRQHQRLINEANNRATTVKNEIDSFKARCVWPYNKYVFQDNDFVASEYLIEDSKYINDEESKNLN